MTCRTLPLAVFCTAAIVALQAQTHAFGQNDTPPPATARGENFSAKPAPALFASDCTGAGCHKGPQGLGQRAGLAGFLREHYTNSRESAAALASYLASIPAPVERATRPAAPPGRARAAARPDEEPPATAPASRGRRAADPEPPARPARGQRGRQATATPAPAPSEPPEAPPAPPSQVFDIFD
jgi:hypothetical protein